MQFFRFDKITITDFIFTKKNFFLTNNTNRITKMKQVYKNNKKKNNNISKLRTEIVKKGYEITDKMKKEN